MSRPRKYRPAPAEFPPQLAEFNIDDWWVTDPEDPMEAEYARIKWAVARKVYAEGGDWESHLSPPVWWTPNHN